jgi:hypothetical protein
MSALTLFATLAPVLCIAAPVDPAPELALCRTEPASMAALSRVSTRARSAPEGRLLKVGLAPEKSVAFPGTSPDFEKARAQVGAGTYGGVLRLEVTRPGVYRIGVAQDAWVDVATASGKLLDPAPDEGAFTCDGAQKVLIYGIPAAGTYWLQIALSAQRATMLTLIRGG